MNADGAGAPEEIWKGDGDLGATSWSADGRLFVLFQTHPETDGDITVLPVDGERKPRLFLQTPADEGGSTLSPDGRFLAYVSNESGTAEVYVQPFPGGGGKWQISTEGGREPVWSRSGVELFYRTADRMMVVSLETEPRFQVGTPRVLFTDPYAKQGWFIANYDVSPDGRKFLMVKGEEVDGRLVVVQNWPELLRRGSSGSREQ
jgi:serine/threonine-protein kinase